MKEVTEKRGYAFYTSMYIDIHMHIYMYIYPNMHDKIVVYGGAKFSAGK